MNNLKVVGKEDEPSMTSLELAKVFGIQHTRVMARLGKLADKDECTYAPISYTDSMNRQQTMFEINMALAIQFVASSDHKDKALFLAQLLHQHGMCNHAPQIEDQSDKIEQLKQDNENLKNDVRVEKAKQLEDSDNVERVVRRSHAALNQLCEEGICEKHQHIRNFYEWPVTEYGRELGWYNNQNGTLVHPEMG